MYRFQVPPADLEGLLLSHDDVADAAVIGVHSEKEATELPRYAPDRSLIAIRSSCDLMHSTFHFITQ